MSIGRKVKIKGSRRLNLPMRQCASILRFFPRQLHSYKRLKFSPLVLIITLFLLCLLVLKNIFPPADGWWRFSSLGRIYHEPAYSKGLIFFGNGYGHFYAIDSRSGISRWTFQAENGISSQPVIHGNKVLFESYDGTLFSLKAKSGEEVWRFTSDNYYSFSSPPTIIGNTILVSDAGGRLYAVDANSGKSLWKFDANTPETVSSIHNGILLMWMDYISAHGDTVYFASKDGYIYALSILSGDLKWKYDTGSVLTVQPEIIGPYIFLGNKNGDTFAIQRKDGRVVWSQDGAGNPVTCLKGLDPLGEFNSPSDNRINLIANLIFKTWSLGNTSIIKVTSNQGVAKVNVKNGNEIWKKDVNAEFISCPNKWFSYLFFADATGEVRAIDEADGSDKWEVELGGKVFSTPVLAYNWNYPIQSPLLYFVTNSGDIHAFNARNGKEIWSFSTFLHISSPLTIRGDYLYVGSIDGGLYRIKYNSGRLDKPARNNKIETAQSLIHVGDSQIVELTIAHDDAWYTNPWSEVETETTFEHESGKKIQIYGFYYDKNTWKVRFNPTTKGSWKWQLQFKTPDSTLKDSGEFVSETDTTKAFLRKSKENPLLLTMDDEHIFNAIGIGDGILDSNTNGNPLDDWAIGDSTVFMFDSPFGFKERYPSDEVVDLATYLDTYGDGGKVFNLYRWSVGNWSFRLWDRIDTHNKYLIPEGKYGDTFIQSLKNHNFKVFMTLFGFDIFAKDINYPENRELIRHYIKYVLARFGAYVDIWEIANEAIVSDDIVRFIADEIRSLDHESRLISMSPERPNMDEVDIISPHWYETEDLSESDLTVKEQIEKFQGYEKPIIFGEQGNVIKNWDETSALRMRVRSWVAFFEEAILIFWNQSDNKDFHNSAYGNANIFLGEEERNYVRFLQNFTKDVSLSAEKIPLEIQNSAVRSYGLVSDKELLGYFFHYEYPDRETSFRIMLDFPEETEVEWYDPTTGEVVWTQAYSAGHHLLLSPEFTSDIALKARFLN